MSGCGASCSNGTTRSITSTERIDCRPGMLASHLSFWPRDASWPVAHGAVIAIELDQTCGVCFQLDLARLVSPKEEHEAGNCRSGYAERAGHGRLFHREQMGDSP